jgi:MFS transporter, AAHS family, 4-hydroxybenzoate transporter
VTRKVDIGQILDEGEWSGRQKFFVLLTALTIVFDGVDNQLLGISVPAIMREWSLPRSAFAPILAAGMIGMMIGGAIAGLIGDRLGRRVALIGSVFVFGVLTAAAALVDNLWALGTLRFLAGLGLGGAMPNAAALASEYVPRRHRPFAITLTIVCVPLGGTLAAVVSGYIMPVLGWRALFAAGGLISVAVGAVLIWLLPESPRFLARNPRRWTELAGILKQIGHSVPHDAEFVDRADRAEQNVAKASVSALVTPAYRRDTAALWAAMFACMLAVYTAFNWIPSMIAGAGLGLSVASNGLAAFNLGGVAGAIGGGLVIARIGSRPTMIGLSGAAIVACLVLAFQAMTASSPTLPLVALLGVSGGAINATQTTLYALAAHIYPTMVRATGVGTSVAFGRVGGVLSTYAGAWALEAGGTRAFFTLMAGAMTVVCVALALIKRHVPGPSPKPPAPSRQST